MRPLCGQGQINTETQTEEALGRTSAVCFKTFCLRCLSLCVELTEFSTHICYRQKQDFVLSGTIVKMIA